MKIKKMLQFTFSLTLLVILFTSQSFSQYLARESFQYTIGTKLDTLIGKAENGWAGPWDLYDGPKERAMVTDTGFAYNDLNYTVANVGNHLVGSNQGSYDSHRYSRSLEKLWPDETGRVYWFSMLMEIKNAPTADCWLGVKLCKDQSSEYMMFGKGWGMTVYTLGSGYHGSAGPETSTTNWDVGPVWIVAKIVMSGNSSSEKSYMWLNPDPKVVPDTLTSVAKSSPSINDGFKVVKIEFGGQTVGMTVHFDEIRLGTSYAEVSGTISHVINELNQIPSDYSLSQNYPNPFNPNTKIKYSIKESGIVRLSIFDLLGKEVEVVLNKEQTAGSYEVDYAPKNLASGIYFYKLQTNNQVITKKMMLLK